MQQRGRLIQQALEPLDWYHGLLHTMGGGFLATEGQGWKDIIGKSATCIFSFGSPLMDEEGIYRLP